MMPASGSPNSLSSLSFAPWIMRPTHFLSISLALCLTASAPALADLYRWTDDKGQVHYSDRAPAGQQSQRIGPSSNPRQEMEAEAARRALADKVSQAKQQRQQEQAAEEKKQAEAEKQRKKEELCRQARERLAVLRHTGPVARVNDRGERYYLDESQKQSEAADAQRRVEELCK
jgi:hypothetical protein